MGQNSPSGQISGGIWVSGVYSKEKNEHRENEMTDPKDSKPTEPEQHSTTGPKLMLGGIFAALVGMGWAVLTAKRNAGRPGGSKPSDPAP